jgi:RNA-directed DNA polymerase
MERGKGSATFMASNITDPKTRQLMEQVVDKTNLERALKAVRANKGSPGVDGMTVDELAAHLRRHWPEMKKRLLKGTYEPQPVKRVEIPKPGGGVRLLGVPTVVDRFIQQAVLQMLTPIYDPTFSPHSYGFRPGRNTHQAVKQAQAYISEGYEWVVDLDLEKFFDRVNHDVLMGRIAKRIEDKRLLKLIRRYLQAGVMVNGVVMEREEGTPQGGPLSPLLSNILLDEFDKELEARGHKFCRYADDANIYVRSQKAGERVLSSVKRWLDRVLRLKVNEAKSAVAKPEERKFLGFSFFWDEEGRIRRRISPQALERAKETIRDITRRTGGISMEEMIRRLNRYLNGWMSAFRITEAPSVLKRMDGWIRRRLRCLKLVQWKQQPKTRYRGLRQLGLSQEWAATLAGSSKGPWALSKTPQLEAAFSVAHFHRMGLVSLFDRCHALQSF